MKRKLLISFIYFLFTYPSFAFVGTVNPAGIPIRWQYPIEFNLAGNPLNNSQLSSDDFFHAVVFGLQRWKAASNQSIQFDYWQGFDPNYFPSNNDYNGTSSIYFASHGNHGTLSPNVLGLTQVWYNTDSGEILETDIVLNDINFNFTNNPTDTSGFGAGHSTFTNGKNNVYIQNVITHELGHALGLSHSGGLQSTMLFMESPEQAHLGCDELSAIPSIYPTSNHDSFGKIQGRIISESGLPVFGVHVLAISQQRGTVLATTLSDPSGSFTLSGLEPGTYYLMAEPFYAGPQALPAFYASLNSTICTSGNLFSRSLLTNSDQFHLIPIPVSPNQTHSAPPLTVRCNQQGGAYALENVLANSPYTSPILNEPGFTSNDGFGIIDKINYSSTNYYRINGVSGNLEVHALGYSLYSPISISLSLLNSSGTPIPMTQHEPVYQGDSGYTNHDAAFSADGLAPGDYILRVRTTSLQMNDFPAGPISLDHVPFIMMTGSINGVSPSLGNIIPSNARCRISEDFPAYVSPSGNPRKSRAHQNNDDGSGFCGTIDPSNSVGPKDGASASALAGWFLPWIFMLSASRWVIYLHRRFETVNLKG
jgi:hypothetical protein